MDENQAELLRLIYTRIGIIMEDASITAIDLGGPKSAFDRERVGNLRKSVDAISTLTVAAEAIQE